MSMIPFAANARVLAGSVRQPRRALRDCTHRGPAVRYHGAARAPRGAGHAWSARAVYKGDMLSYSGGVDVGGVKAY